MMKRRARRACWCMIGFFCFTSFAGTVGDLRVVEAVKNSHRAAVRALLRSGQNMNFSCNETQ